MTDSNRYGAKQPKRFDPARAARLDDPARLSYLAPDAILTSLDLAAGATLVDFGAGTGLYAIEIARARPDVRLLALDEQPEMRERLRRNIATAGITTIKPIGPEQVAGLRGKVDRIFALNVLHELGDDALTDLAELLAPRGRALVIDWNADADRPVGPPREHIYSPMEGRERLEKRGFRIIDQPMFPYHYGFIVDIHT